MRCVMHPTRQPLCHLLPENRSPPPFPGENILSGIAQLSVTASKPFPSPLLQGSSQTPPAPLALGSEAPADLSCSLGPRQGRGPGGDCAVSLSCLCVCPPVGGAVAALPVFLGITVLGTGRAACVDRPPCPRGRLGMLPG